MKLLLAENKTIKQARKALRHSGYRLTVRNGCIYTIKATEIKQPRSEKQQKNWEIMAKATKMADMDLKKSDRKRYWMIRAIKEGYKTARGCARAHYIKILKAGEKETTKVGKGNEKANRSIVKKEQKRLWRERCGVKVWQNSNKTRARVRKSKEQTAYKRQQVDNMAKKE